MDDDTADWLSKAWDEQIKKGRQPSWSRPLRIVSYERYAMAEKAAADGATPREIELCLAGAKWPDEVKKYIGEQDASSGSPDIERRGEIDAD